MRIRGREAPRSPSGARSVGVCTRESSPGGFMDDDTYKRRTAAGAQSCLPLSVLQITSSFEMTYTTPPQPLRQSRSTPLRRHCEMTSKRSSGSCGAVAAEEARSVRRPKRAWRAWRPPSLSRSTTTTHQIGFVHALAHAVHARLGGPAHLIRGASWHRSVSRAPRRPVGRTGPPPVQRDRVGGAARVQ